MPSNSEKAASELRVLIEKRQRYFQSVQNCFDLITSLSDSTSNLNFIIRAKRCDKHYEEFESIQNRILELNDLVEKSDQISNVLETSKSFEEIYFSVKTVEESLSQSKSNDLHQTCNQPSSGKTKLPVISLPKFDGSYEKFDSFKSLYDTLVHNQEHLSTIEKYSYLLSSVSGLALIAIQGFPFSENSYETAYQTLVSRFTNKRIVASNICQKIFSLKPYTSENQLHGFLEDFNVQVEALKNINLPSRSDFLLCFLALRLLDSQSRQDFEKNWTDPTSVPTYNDVLKFVQGRVASCEIIQSSSSTNKVCVAKPPIKRAMVAQVSATSHSCPCCEQPHRIISCNKFHSLTIPKRYDVLKNNHLCFACFGPHPRASCKSKFLCRHCGSQNHHTLLHSAKSTTSSLPSTDATTNPVVLSGQLRPFANHVDQPTQVLLGTAVVNVLDAFGHTHMVRILIDPGSMVNVISQRLQERLSLQTTPSRLQISGIGTGNVQPVKGSVTCHISSRHELFSLSVDAVILPAIADKLPTVPVSQDVISQMTNVKLADPQFFKPASVDMLIGAQHYAKLLTSEPIHHGQPSLVPTKFGILVMGECSSSSPAMFHSFHVSCAEPDFSTQLQKFWEIEEIPIDKPVDPKDLQCEEHFIKTHYRDSNGVYVVRLPFINGEPPDFGNNYSFALNRFHKLENRLEKMPQFKELYHANLQDYVTSGHMVPSNQPSPYVLTHHGVTKDSSTTKVRVVFNPTEKSNPTSPSLNESLLVGPKLQNNINDIMLNFRLHRVAITGDIKQMYRAIKLDPRDSKYQQILWRFDPIQPVQQFEINRVCFGVTSSPFHALRVLKQLIKDEGHKFPDAAYVLDQDVYIDDVCTGADSEPEARQLRDDLSALLTMAGFELRKWSSSHSAVLSDLPNDFKEKPHKFGDVESIPVLGIQWIAKEDAFCYRIETFPDCTTKRQVLSQIARTYDLPGFLSPIVIWMKILIQRIWLLGLGWDEQLPDSMIHQWNQFICEIPCLQTMKIPRYILDTYINPPELIGFSDASTSAMGAAVYLRVVCSDQRVLVNLIRAKTRVAPVKPVTVPRLELMASDLLAGLIESLQPVQTRLNIKTIYLFTDSSVVLSWLRTPAHLLKVFVANRVVRILDRTLPTQWFHVPTAENPADIASRGCMPSEILSCNLWWYGPTFLTKDHSAWPKRDNLLPDCNLPELKPTAVVAVSIPINPDGINLIERFSSFTHAQRVISWILRFKRNCLLPVQCRSLGSLTVEELCQGENVMIKITQSYYFSNVFDAISSNQKLPPSLLQLSPFVSSGYLRVGGRLDKAPLPYDSRHPFLIPAKSHFAYLIVNYYHQYSIHGGPTLVQSLVQAKFFVPGLRNLVRKTIFQCVKCYRFNAKPRQPFMAELPLSRFAQGRPFIHTGVDLAGPFALKDSTRRNAPIVKVYFAIFVCFAVKAVHLEPLTSLSTPAFLACFDRFASRRGLPHKVFSDQGTNFKGAARVLEENSKFLLINTNAIADHLALKQVQWSFNAPANPSAGGLWEAGVKSVKRHLKVILSDRPLLFEEFYTVLCRIEAILNSRPIGIPASSPEDVVKCLTPGHFLIGSSLLARPEPDFANTPSNRVNRWDFLSQVIQHLWKRWSQEYLHTLIQRQKWSVGSDNVKVGDVVILMVENQPPMSWPLARIVKVFPAADGIVRIVSVRSSSGVLTRPVRKLLVLPICP